MSDPEDDPSIQRKVSPDGKWIWDGHNWVPNPHPTAPQPLPEYPAPFPPATPQQPQPVQPQGAPSVPGPPPPTGPGQQPPRSIAYLPPEPPQKQGHALRNILLSCAVLAILMVAGCAVFIGVAVNQVGDEIDKQVAKAGDPGSQGDTATVQEGDAFRLDGLRYPAGWTFGENQIGMLSVKDLRVENPRENEATVVIRFEVMKNDQVVATVHCTSDSVPSGGTGRLECLGADQLPKRYDDITVTDLF